MNIEEVTFDNFMSLPESERNRILSDPELLKPLIRKNMKRSRYEHSLSTADTCRKLALCHGYDPDKAYLCGLLHDVCKFPNDSESGELHDILERYDPDKLNSVKGAYHSWAAKYYLQEKLGFRDEEILTAIYNHTICEANDTLSLILYIADKREPGRGINDEILQIAETDLHKAFDLLEKDVERYLKENNERFVKNSI